MNPDEYDFFRSFKKAQQQPPSNTGLDLLRSLEDRNYGHFRKYVKSKEHRELFAEEELLRKEAFEELQCEMPGLSRSTFLMVFSPDGTKVASTHGNHNIYVTDIRSGKNIRTLVGHPRTPWCIAFHPNSNQIVASGCLGGQVRIWDLSGGSEVWTSSNQSVIASIAFHPNDRILVIATYNEVHFWDWSMPEPFCHAATGNIKDKVRYVAFDKLGHKLITGIANSPQTRWERVRSSVPVPRPADRTSAGSYRRRITPRIFTFESPRRQNEQDTNRETFSTVPQRERRIAMYYGNLVREYEQLVQRYLQLYRPPTMIDRGTDPMEPNQIINTSGTQTPNPEEPTPGTSGVSGNTNEPGPSTSYSTAVSPKLIFAMIKQKKPMTLIRGTQTSESRKHKSTESNGENQQEKKAKIQEDAGEGTSKQEMGTQTQPNRKTLVISPKKSAEESVKNNPVSKPCSGKILCKSKRRKALDESVSSVGVNESAEGKFRRTEEAIFGSSLNLSSSISGSGEAEAPTPSCSYDSPMPGTSRQSRNISDLEKYRKLKEKTELLRAQIDAHGRNITPDASSDINRLLASLRQFIESMMPDLVGNSSNSLAESNLPSTSSATDSRLNRNLAEIQKELDYFKKVCELRLRRERRWHNRYENGRDEPSLGEEREISLAGILGSEQVGDGDSPSATEFLTETNLRNEGLVSNIRDLRVRLERCDNALSSIQRATQRSGLVGNVTGEHFRSNSEASARGRSTASNFHNKRRWKRLTFVDTSSETTSSDDETLMDGNNFSNASTSLTREGVSNMPRTSITTGASSTGNSQGTLRNFNTELEELLTNLLEEIERREQTESQSSVHSQDAAGPSRNYYSQQNNRLNWEEDSWTQNLSAPSPSSPLQNSALQGRTSQAGDVRGQVHNRRAWYRQNRGSLSNRARQNEAVRNQSAMWRPLRLGSPTRTPIRLRLPPLVRRNGVFLRRWRSDATPYGNTSSSPTRDLPLNSDPLRSDTPPANSAPDEVINYSEEGIEDSERVNWERLVSPTGDNSERLPNDLFPNLNASPPSSTPNESADYSERRNPLDELGEQPFLFHPFNPPPEIPAINPENIGIGNMYSNIIQDLESSLIDVRSIRSSYRPGETSDMLSNFSERLENIMNQSETILRNLRSSMDMLPAPNDAESRASPPGEPTLSFNDPNFYVREAGVSSTDNAFDDTPNSVATDHTYPRTADSTVGSSAGDNMTPLMTSLHMTISYIQRQARLLRQQVESIERIDRAMVEVAQVQLIRQMIIELKRHVHTLAGESRSTGISSVRQMMAGTRISDSSPYDSPAEDSNGSTGQQRPAPALNLGVATSSAGSASTESTGTAPSSSSSSSRPRCSNRKTYPPSRLSRLQRQNRKTTVIHYLPRRCILRPDRNFRVGAVPRPIPQPTSSSSLDSLDPHALTQYAVINSSTLSSMFRRLELLLNDQIRRVIGRSAARQPPRTRHTAVTDLGEHIIALRLHGCILRFNRVNGRRQFDLGMFRSYRADATAVSRDGVERYHARHTLSLIIDGMSRHLEDMGGGSGSMAPPVRAQMQGVLNMALLLSELLLLQIVVSIPPPTGINLDHERESLTNRIDQMCSMMLLNRCSGYSQQLTHNLRMMRLTMRHAFRTIGQTNSQQNSTPVSASLTSTTNSNNVNSRSSPSSIRPEFLGFISRSLRVLNRSLRSRDGATTADDDYGDDSSTPGASRLSNGWDTINSNPSRNRQSSNENGSHNSLPGSNLTSDNFSIQNRIGTLQRTSNNNENADIQESPNTSATTSSPFRHLSPIATISMPLRRSNDFTGSPPTTPPPPMYRLSDFINPPPTSQPENSTSSRTNPSQWSVPSVLLNDVMLPDVPNTGSPRVLPYRLRFAERVSELRSNPTIGSLFRPRFLHPLYSSVNPFDADLDDPQREQIHDSDLVTTVTPNHRIQVWDISGSNVPTISNPLKNVVVRECKIHNDASVDVSADGTILVTLLPSGGYLNVTNRLGVYSLKWETLGQCLYTTSFEQNAVSVSLSPLSRHLVVGLASRRVSIVPSERWTMARIFKIEQKEVPGDRLPVVRELEQSRDGRVTNHKSLNCIRWLPTSGQGLIYATNTGQLVILT